METLVAKCHYEGEKEASRSDLEHLDNAETTFLEWGMFALRWLFIGNFFKACFVIKCI